jgi:beta-mannosidase
MISYSLDGEWELDFGPTPAENKPIPPIEDDAWRQIEAQVPGNVEIAMQKERIIQDPMIGRRVYRLREYESFQWWYRRNIEKPAFDPHQRVELVFDGIDTIATVLVNHSEVGTARNMFVQHRFDITDYFAEKGPNYLAVRIDSPVLEGRKREPDAMECANDLSWEALGIRKAPHMYGGDSLPRLVSAGLWRSVRLEIVNPTRWRSVYCTTLKANAKSGTAQILLDWDFVTDRADTDDMRVRIIIEREEKVAYTTELTALGTHGRRRIDLTDVTLWWPRGSGEAALYDLTLELVDADGMVLDTYGQPLGIRTIRLERTEVTMPEQPGEFVFRVNDEKVFVRGANWVALDALHARDREHLKQTLEMAADLNCNMIRCWGGNVYEGHAFYNYCDRNGIMVWQDFAFARAIYPQNEKFLDEVRAEAEAVVKKLRNHASLALWVGNDENDCVFAPEVSGVGLGPNVDRISREVLPSVVRRCDPVRDYLPGSPNCGPPLVAAPMRRCFHVEDHVRDSRDDHKGPYYSDSCAHFASKIGYYGCPRTASLRRMFDPAHLWPWTENDQWVTKAVRPHTDFKEYNQRLPLLAKHITMLFPRVPTGMDEFVLASQISQAEALKFFIERFRMGKWLRTGIVWWNLRDGWPVISDAVVDYYFGKKLAYAYIKRVQENVCVMCAEASGGGGDHRVIGVNDTREEANVKLIVRDAEFGTNVLEGEGVVAANEKASLGTVPRTRTSTCYLIEYTIGDTTYRNHYIAGPRPYDLRRYASWMMKMALEEEFTKLVVAAGLGG